MIAGLGWLCRNDAGGLPMRAQTFLWKVTVYNFIRDQVVIMVETMRAGWLVGGPHVVEVPDFGDDDGNGFWERIEIEAAVLAAERGGGQEAAAE
eukprot:CAMPEP_0119544414 /NCGR_PEP_ID=MMETSP1344-20130328/54715_1 /TAXON_ID=236787 /ORGANISM="Florenciella parvula, Strain CCMP2471" /LENGTH=93 /DNA_ID=CAMNT_0007588913 /DNA_START=157 /DNA_END=435 /DNA_ORIENTATION=+